ncbi:MAG: hypothetical protein HY319_26770 [Armatimonadetes bacterium]|nr:hypothetical protein [Armatimonadota bacterium]
MPVGQSVSFSALSVRECYPVDVRLCRSIFFASPPAARSGPRAAAEASDKGEGDRVDLGGSAPSPVWRAGLATLADLDFDRAQPVSKPSEPPVLDLSSVDPGAALHTIGLHVRQLPCITEGLADAPTMTSGTETRDKIFTQLQMMEHFARGDYDSLYAMIENPSLPEPLRVSKQEIIAVLEPLRQGLAGEDWKILGAVGCFHDLGKLRSEWATERGMDLTDFEGIAHDFDSEALLKHNPELLAPFGLSVEGREKVRVLCRLHSLPGMHCLGEGNAAAYGPLFTSARQEGSENLLKLARAHGLLDVMSAKTRGFVKPILNAHAGLSRFITEAFAQGTPLGPKYRMESSAELMRAPDFRDVANEYGIGPVAMKRLRALTSASLEAGAFRTAFEGLDPQFLYWFNRATDDEDTWYGTFVQSAFGSGMLKAKMPPHEVIQAMVKMVACAARYRAQMEPYHGSRGKWALSALEPQQVVTSGPAGARKVLDQIGRIRDLDDGVKELSGSGGSGLMMRSGNSGVEIGYMAEVDPAP